jgi:hypothetical protein
MDLYIHSLIRLHGAMLNELSSETTLPLPTSLEFTETAFRLYCKITDHMVQGSRGGHLKRPLDE